MVVVVLVSTLVVVGGLVLPAKRNETKRKLNSQLGAARMRKKAAKSDEFYCPCVCDGSFT